jgi:glycosyltransferase involved in cell wall biosynthesis
MDKPRVSVVMPVYCATGDHETYLKEALESVSAQTFRDFDVVLVDDSSPRDFAPLLEAIDALPAVHVVRNDANVGHAESRNTGVRAARGDLIAFLDHDDLWLPGKLARQVAVLDANPDAAMTFCDMEIFGRPASWLKIDQSIIPDRPTFLWFVSHGNYTISASAVMARKSVLEEIGLFDSHYSTCDDFDAWLKIAARASVIHLPERLAKYRLHEHNVNYGVDALNDNKLLTRLIWSYWQTAPIGEKIALLPKLARKLIGRIYFALFAPRRRTAGEGNTDRAA